MGDIDQSEMIERVRRLCQADPRLVAAMMYGSWTRGEGDAFSDIEFVLFFEDAALPGVDQRAWVTRIAPVELYFVNEYGNGAAVFSNLVRGEFHFDRASEMAKVSGWRETSRFPSLDATLILDRTGELTDHLRALIGPPIDRHAPDNIRFVCHSFINWTLFGANVLARGERARALEILGMMQRYLLWLVRLAEHSTAHWPTPSKALEQDISSTAYARYITCTARLDSASLSAAYRSAWSWGVELMESLATQHAIALPRSLFEPISRRLVTADL